MGWNLAMLVARAPDPGDGLLMLCEGMGWHHQDEPTRTTLAEATRREFRGCAAGAFGSCVLAVGPELYPDGVDGDALSELPLVLSFFASENRGGANSLRIFEKGVEVAQWNEGEAFQGHALLEGVEAKHPFDQIQAAAERLLGVRPLELAHHPLVHFPYV